MRQKVLSLLVLLTTVVTGAWAAGESKTTYKAPQVIYERGGTTAWSDADLASWTHSQWLTLTKESNGIQAKSKNGSEAAVYSLNLGDGSIVEIEAEFTLWSNTGRYLNANTGSYFRFGSIYIIENDQDQASAYSLDGFTTNTVFTGISGYRPSSIDGAASYYLTMRVNTATNTLESLAVAPSKGADAVLTLTDVALTNPDYSNVAIGYQKNGSMSYDQIELLKSIKITETKVAYTVALADGTMDADNWTIDPNPAAEGDKVTATYTGAKKVIGVKVEKKAKAAVMTTVTWNSTNVFNSAHENVKLSKWYPTPLSYEGITISFSGTKASSFQAYDEDDHIGSLTCYGNYDDSFTFTAPSGKKFCKIEIINNGSIVFTNYGDWTRDANNNKIVWSGTAANEVTLGSVYTDADDLNSIVFYLSE